MGYILLILFYFGLPVLIVYWTHKSKTADKIGAVVFCYAIGLVIGNIGVVPPLYSEFQNSLSEFLIAIAIPLILFSSDLKQWFKMAGNTFLSLVLGVLATVIVIYIGYFIFRDKVDEAWKISGMLAGVYTGGTPNLAALKTALNVSQNTYIVTHTSDLIFSAVFIFFIISVGQRFFNLFLLKFKLKENSKESQINLNNVNEFNDYSNFFQKNNLFNVVIGILLSLAIVGISLLISSRFEKNSATAIIILSLTTFSIALSFIPKIRNLKKTFPTGMYLIYVFSTIISSMADFSTFNKIESLNIFLFVGFVVFASFFFHSLLSKIFKVDTDTFLISSVALTCSVPFVPIIAGAIKNKHIIIPGVIIGLVGYAIGNYLGIFIAFTLK